MPKLYADNMPDIDGVQYPLQVYKTVNVIDLTVFILVEYYDVTFIYKLNENIVSLVIVNMPVVVSKLSGAVPEYKIPLE